MEPTLDRDFGALRYVAGHKHDPAVVALARRLALPVELAAWPMRWPAPGMMGYIQPLVAAGEATPENLHLLFGEYFDAPGIQRCISESRMYLMLEGARLQPQGAGPEALEPGRFATVPPSLEGQPAQPAALSALRDYRQSAAQVGCVGMECAVCHEPFATDDAVQSLPTCQHRFHETCSTPWFANHNSTCPMCREPVPAFVALQPSEEEQAMIAGVRHFAELLQATERDQAARHEARNAAWEAEGRPPSQGWDCFGVPRLAWCRRDGLALELRPAARALGLREDPGADFGAVSFELRPEDLPPFLGLESLDRHVQFVHPRSGTRVVVYWVKIFADHGNGNQLGIGWDLVAYQPEGEGPWKVQRPREEVADLREWLAGCLPSGAAEEVVGEGECQASREESCVHYDPQVDLLYPLSEKLEFSGGSVSLAAHPYRPELVVTASSTSAMHQALALSTTEGTIKQVLRMQNSQPSGTPSGVAFSADGTLSMVINGTINGTVLMPWKFNEDSTCWRMIYGQENIICHDMHLDAISADATGRVLLRRHEGNAWVHRDGNLTSLHGPPPPPPTDFDSNNGDEDATHTWCITEDTACALPDGRVVLISEQEYDPESARLWLLSADGESITDITPPQGLGPFSHVTTSPAGGIYILTQFEDDTLPTLHYIDNPNHPPVTMRLYGFEEYEELDAMAVDADHVVYLAVVTRWPCDRSIYAVRPRGRPHAA